MFNLLLVDDEKEMHGLIKQVFKKDDIRIFNSHSVKDAIKELTEEDRIDIAVLDYNLYDGTAEEIIKAIDASGLKIPVVVITAGEVDKIGLFEQGIISFITKPFDVYEFRYNILNLLKLQKSIKQIDEFRTITIALSKALETRDTYTEGHSTRVWEFATMLYNAIGLDDEEDKRILKVGCFLHDLGKIGIPDSILKSNKRLTKEEYEMVKKHPEIGGRICKNIPGIEGVQEIIRHHHERLDGSGYPDGLKGNEIKLLTRIVSIADVFDALTSKRSYRSENSPKKALQILKEESDKGLLDEFLVGEFINIVEQYT